MKIKDTVQRNEYNMRAYVVSGEDYSFKSYKVGDQHPRKVIIGVASSRSHAIKMCEEWLNSRTDNIVEWETKWLVEDKHKGNVTKGFNHASYDMFRVNQSADIMNLIKFPEEEVL